MRPICIIFVITMYQPMHLLAACSLIPACLLIPYGTYLRYTRYNYVPTNAPVWLSSDFQLSYNFHSNQKLPYETYPNYIRYNYLFDWALIFIRIKNGLVRACEWKRFGTCRNGLVRFWLIPIDVRCKVCLSLLEVHAYRVGKCPVMVILTVFNIAVSLV